ncbi:glycosyltransferase [Holdemanella porci]|uniref:glycosyltransferase n=1 Tax=Holdemanella porci TaxID=2652276 RepID=UPI003F8B6288
MKNIYIVFDKLHSNEAGGLVSAYASLIQLLKDDYTIKVISIINSNLTRHDMFSDCEIINVSKFDFFPRMEIISDSLKSFKLLLLLKELFKLLCYFCYIPISRIKMRNWFSSDDIIIVSSPAAAMFMSSKNRFILEIHTKFEYFWGTNKLGRLQSKLMSKPYITVFRTKADMEKASKNFNSTYSYNFINKELFNDTVSIGEKIRKHKIIYMGRFGKEKNLPKMIECAKQLKKQIPDFTLDMYGTGVLVDDIAKLIEENDLSENVHLCGFCNDKNIFDNYSLLWLTSDFEGMSMTIIEAKAKGVPTISTNWGDGVFEVIHDKEDGFVENTVEDIVNRTAELMNDKELLINISKNAFKNFDEFSKENAYKRWIDLLKGFEGELE